MTTAREADDLTLTMVRMRAAGDCVTEIATRFGKTPQFVSTATNRVMRADMAESGEDVSGCYWQTVQRRAS